MGGRPIPRRQVALIALFSLGCVVAIIAAWSAFGGALPLQPKGYRVTAAFPNARTLVPGSDVRISGISVGRVVDVRAGVAATEAVMEIEPRFAPLHADAQALLRSKTPLGESYVAITPGRDGTPLLADGGAIPPGQVVPNQQIEDVLSALDPATRRALRHTVTDVAATLDGEGGTDLNAAVGAAGPATEELGVVLQALDAQRDDVQALVDRTGAALDAVARRPAQLRGLVTAGDAVLSTTGARARQLTATVASLDRFVEELSATDPALQRTLTTAGPTLAVLRPVAPLAVPALDAVDRFAPAATRLLQRLPATLRLAQHTVPSLTALLPVVGRTGDALARAGAQVIPLVQLLEAYGQDAVDALGTQAGAFEATKGTGQGSASRYARTAVYFTPEATLGFKHREPSTRANAYPAPGTQYQGLAWDCSNVHNPATTAESINIPCQEAGPWTFRGASRMFPLLTAYKPK